MIVLVLFASVLAIGFSHRSAVHPGAVQMLASDPIDNLQCRDGEGPESSLEAPRPARSLGTNISGQYRCYRPVFNSDERNPYIDLALTAESARAKRVVQSLSRQLELQKPVPNTIGVRIEGVPEAGLRADLAAIYRVELNALLGAGHVRYGAEPEVGQPVLVIRVRRVDVPQLMSRAQLESLNKKGERAWIDI